MKKIIIIISIILAVIILCLLFTWLYLNFSLKNDRKSIIRIIKKNYPEYELSDKNFGFSYCDKNYCHDVDEGIFKHRATNASVIIISKDDGLYLSFKKNILGIWKMTIVGNTNSLWK